MTKINDLTALNRILDRNLFVIYDGHKTRSISAAILKNYIGSLDYNPDAFVSGKMVDSHLLMTQQDGKVIDLGKLDLSQLPIEDLSNVPPLEPGKLFQVNLEGKAVEFVAPFNLSEHNIQEIKNVSDLKADAYLRVNDNGTSVVCDYPRIQDLSNVPELQATKYFKVNATGDAVVFAESSEFDLRDHDIQELKNVLPLVADRLLKVTRDGTAIDYIPVPTFDIGNYNIQDLKNVPELLPGRYLKVNVEGTGVEYGILSPETYVTTDSEQTITTTKIFTSIQYFYDAIQLWHGENTSGLRINPLEDHVVLSAINGSIKKDAIKITNDGSVDIYFNSIAKLQTYEYGVYVSQNIPQGSMSLWYNPTENNKTGGLEVNQDGKIKTVLKTFDKGGTGIFDLRDDWSKVPCLQTRGDGIEIRNGKNTGDSYAYITEQDTKFNLGYYSAGIYFTGLVVDMATKGTALNYNAIKTLETTDNGIIVGIDTNILLHLWSSTGECGMAVRGASGSGNIIRRTGDGVTYMYARNQQAGLWTFNHILGGQLNGTWNGTVTPSQKTIKTNITPITGLDKINKLEPITWDWQKPQFFDASIEKTGFSLESWEQVFPELVDDYRPFDHWEVDQDGKEKELTPDDKKKEAYFKGIKGIKKSITSLKMDAIVVAAIQELSKKVDSLQQEIETLKRGGDHAEKTGRQVETPSP